MQMHSLRSYAALRRFRELLIENDIADIPDEPSEADLQPLKNYSKNKPARLFRR